MNRYRVQESTAIARDWREVGALPDAALDHAIELARRKNKDRKPGETIHRVWDREAEREVYRRGWIGVKPKGYKEDE